MTTARSDEIACIELVELVTDYLEDAVSETDRERIDRHLAECDGCTAYLEQIRQTIAAAGRLVPDDLPPAALETLLVVFRSEHDARRPE